MAVCIAFLLNLLRFLQDCELWRQQGGGASSFLPQGEGLSDGGAEMQRAELLRRAGGTLALSSEPPDQALPEPGEAQDLSPRLARIGCLVQHKEI